jgi:V8-like Glu-specific endopeptidase
MTTGQTTSVGVVLPGDNRVRVADSTLTPFRWVGQLETTWSDGSRSTGTGTLFADLHLLTCAHNLYDARLGEARRAVFRPALNRTGHGVLMAPYGEFGVRGFGLPIQYRTSPPPRPPAGGIPRVEITRYLWDYAVARLDGPLPSALDDPPYTVGADPTSTAGAAGSIVGYSGDLDPSTCTQYHRNGRLAVDGREEFVTYTMSTYPGDSGAAVAYQPPARPWWVIAAIHVTGVPPTHPGAADGLNFGPALFNSDEIERLREEADRHRLS